MKVFELIEKLRRVDESNFVFMKIGRKKHCFDGNTDDIGDVDLYSVHRDCSRFKFVRNLLKFLKQNNSQNEAFLEGPNNMPYSFTGLKYDKNANVILYVKKGDVPA